MAKKEPKYMVIDQNTGIDENPKRWLDKEEALEAVFSGKSKISNLQNEPPVWVLDELLRRLKNVDLLGPATTDSCTFDKIKRNVFPNNLKQHIVDSQTLNWKLGFDAILGLVQVVLSNCDYEDQNVFAQSEAVFDLFKVRLKLKGNENPEHDKLSTNPFVDPRGLPMYGEYIVLDQKLIGPNMTPGKPFYVGRDWFEYHQKLNSIRKTLRELVSSSFGLGIILACESRPAGDALMPADLVLGNLLNDETPNSPNGREFCFLLTRDLPAAWFAFPETRPSMISKGIRWVESAEKELHAKGLRASKRDYINVMMKKFGLSEHGADCVWKQADRIYKDRAGNFPKDIKVNEADLLQIDLNN